MESNNGGNKKNKGSWFYSHLGGVEDKPTSPAEQAGDQAGEPAAKTTQAPEKVDNACASAQEPQAGDVTPGVEEDPGGQVDKTTRRKFWTGALVLVLFAAALCAAGLIGDRLGLFSSDAGPAKASTLVNSDPGLFLKAQPWEKKKHDSLKSLSKMKNLKYVLEFFDEFTPAQVAAVPAHPSNTDDSIANFDKLVGEMVSMDATVVGKYPVSENIELKSNTPSTLLSLSTNPVNGGASMLVIGSTLDNIKAGDRIGFRCIPVYYYKPKDKPEDGGIFFITIPELIYKD